MVTGLKVYCGWATAILMSTSREMVGKSTGFVAYEGRLNVWRGVMRVGQREHG